MTTQETEHIVNQCHAFAKYDADQAFANVQQNIKNKHAAQKRQLWTSLSAIAAVVAITLLLWSPYQRISNDNNLPLLVQLPDGSEVSLNKGTSIVFAKQMKTKRRLKLKGEAFFDIAADANHPFVIKANHYQVKVIGTSFNVKCIDTEASVEVMVKTGTVEVSNREHQQVILTPGDFARGIETHEISTEKPIVDPNYLSWYQQKLVFNASPIDYVLEVIENTYHCKVSLDDAELSSLKISTTFDGLSIEEVLTSICLTLNLSLNEEENDYILYQK